MDIAEMLAFVALIFAVLVLIDMFGDGHGD
jgi:hypothetical protein